MIGVEQAGRLVPVEFIPAPTIAPEDIKDFLGFIEKLQETRVRSFGARLIKNVTDDDLAKCLKWLDERNPGYDPQYFSKNSRLHTDSGQNGDITFHHTKIGRAKLFVLVGAVLDETTNPHIYSDVAAQRLLQDGLLDTQELQIPSLALVAEVGPKDLVAFDHSQPHMVQNLTESRNSTAYY